MQNTLKKIHELHIPIKLRYHAISMAITNFVWVELDRAIHKELSFMQSLLVSAFFENVK